MVALNGSDTYKHGALLFATSSSSLSTRGLRHLPADFLSLSFAALPSAPPEQFAYMETTTNPQFIPPQDFGGPQNLANESLESDLSEELPLFRPSGRRQMKVPMIEGLTEEFYRQLATASVGDLVLTKTWQREDEVNENVDVNSSAIQEEHSEDGRINEDSSDEVASSESQERHSGDGYDGSNVVDEDWEGGKPVDWALPVNDDGATEGGFESELVQGPGVDEGKS